MKWFQLCIALTILALLSACTMTKQVYIVDNVPPPRIKADIASQESIGYPPIFRPKGKRRTIRPGSQYFTLAIPNAIDTSGRAQDLQRSLADMLYTELFTTGRFNLLDRGELVDLDPEWLATSLKKSLTEFSENYSNIENKKNIMDTTVSKTPSAFDKTFEYLDRKNKIQKELASKLKSADGILLVYITSRVGGKKGGYFSVDYRIVNRRGKDENDKTSDEYGRDIILFAGSKKVKYVSSTVQEIEYSRDDIVDIAHTIVNIFPHPKEVKNAHVIKRDQDIIAIDRGRDQQLIPGMTGYVVYSEDSIRVEDYERSRHYSYLGEFIITEVFDKSSTARLLKPYYVKDKSNFIWDINVGDAIVIK